MSKNVSEFIVDRMEAWGVKRIFGYPGDGIAGLDVAVDDADKAGRIKFVQVRHEEMAAFMAAAHAKFTGEVGVCMATSGPGAVHLLNGLYDARLDHMPVVALVGQHGTPVIGGSDQQELDLKALFKDVSGAFCEMASTPEQVRHLVDRAFRIAIAERRVTTVVLPANIQVAPAVEKPPHGHGFEHSSIGYEFPNIVPKEATLLRAADILNEGKKVSILVGAGAMDATDEVIAVADLLGCGIAKALLGKAAVPDDLPFVTGSIGLLGTQPSSDMMLGCDTLFMIGSGFPWTEFLPKEGQARGVQIDVDPEMLGLRYPMDVHMHGDAKLTLQALIPLLRPKSDRSWRDGIEKNVAKWWKTLEERAMAPAEPLNPQRVFWELSPRLPERAIVTADSGSAANWYARDLKFRRGMMGSLSGSLASLGAGTPYAVAAKFAYPDRTVIACMGDGAMQMNGMNVLITVSKYWREWQTPHWICSGPQQPRPQSGHVGGTHPVGRAQNHVHPVDPRRALPQICRTAWAEGHLRGPSGQGGRGLGGGARLRPAGGARSLHRPQRAAAAAAHHAGAGQDVRGIRPTRSRARQHHPQRRAAGLRRRPGVMAPLHAGTPEAAVTALRVSAYTIPTDAPEADGTFAWEATTLVMVEAEGGGETGLGYTYADASAAKLIATTLAKAVQGADALSPPRAYAAMQHAVRNIGRGGLVAMAISAVDAALWDLKARLFGQPLCAVLGRVRDAVPIYGSGGFTTYTDAQLTEQLGGWVSRDGCSAVKMKIGTAPGDDPRRMGVARRAIGDHARLFIDANGAFDAKGAQDMAKRAHALDVRWFEEPVSSDDLGGMALVRSHVAAPIEIAAGEYAATLDDVRAMLAAGAVDVQQADLTRCGGVTGFLRAAALCEAFHTDLSGHCAPAIHLHAACAAPRLRHLEWFHDHARIEAILFDGSPVPQNGAIKPDLSRPGHGLTLRAADAAHHRVA